MNRPRAAARKATVIAAGAALAVTVSLQPSAGLVGPTLAAYNPEHWAAANITADEWPTGESNSIAADLVFTVLAGGSGSSPFTITDSHRSVTEPGIDNIPASVSGTDSGGGLLGLLSGVTLAYGANSCASYTVGPAGPHTTNCFTTPLKTADAQGEVTQFSVSVTVLFTSNVIRTQPSNSPRARTTCDFGGSPATTAALTGALQFSPNGNFGTGLTLNMGTNFSGHGTYPGGTPMSAGTLLTGRTRIWVNASSTNTADSTSALAETQVNIVVEQQTLVLLTVIRMQGTFVHASCGLENTMSFASLFSAGFSGDTPMTTGMFMRGMEEFVQEEPGCATDGTSEPIDDTDEPTPAPAAEPDSETLCVGETSPPTGPEPQETLDSEGVESTQTQEPAPSGDGQPSEELIDDEDTTPEDETTPEESATDTPGPVPADSGDTEGASEPAPTTEPQPSPPPIQITVGSPFTMTSLQGTALGTATVQEVVYDPKCPSRPQGTHVAIHLTISTSAATNTDRLAGVSATDFGELSPNGTIVSFQNSVLGCTDAIPAIPSTMIPSSTYNGWIVFDVGGPNTQLVFAPSTTAGWWFTLPPQPPPPTTSAEVPPPTETLPTTTEPESPPAPTTTTEQEATTPPAEATTTTEAATPTTDEDKT